MRAEVVTLQLPSIYKLESTIEHLLGLPGMAGMQEWERRAGLQGMVRGDAWLRS